MNLGTLKSEAKRLYSSLGRKFLDFEAVFSQLVTYLPSPVRVIHSLSSGRQTLLLPATLFHLVLELNGQ
jgi:hypothetical protein